MLASGLPQALDLVDRMRPEVRLQLRASGAQSAYAMLAPLAPSLLVVFTLAVAVFAKGLVLVSWVNPLSRRVRLLVGASALSVMAVTSFFEAAVFWFFAASRRHRFGFGSSLVCSI